MLTLHSICIQIRMVECVDSSKSALNQKASVVKEVNENEDEQTPSTKLWGKDLPRKEFLNWRSMSWMARNPPRSRSSWNVWRLSLRILQWFTFCFVNRRFRCMVIRTHMLFNMDVIVDQFISSSFNYLIIQLSYCMLFMR